MVGWSQDELQSVLIYVKLSSWSDELLHYQRQTAELQVFSLLSSQIDYPQPPSVSGTSWSESHLSVLRWIMSGATVGTKVRTQQLSKHQSGYYFQSGCWPHLRVNTGPCWALKYQTELPFTLKTVSLLSDWLRNTHKQPADGWWRGVYVSCDLVSCLVSLQVSLWPAGPGPSPKHQHGAGLVSDSNCLICCSD